MSKRVMKSVVALRSVEGARSATGSERSAPAAGAEVKRWSANRKKEVVLRLLRGEPLDALSRELGVETYRHWSAGAIVRWRAWRRDCASAARTRWSGNWTRRSTASVN